MYPSSRDAHDFVLNFFFSNSIKCRLSYFSQHVPLNKKKIQLDFFFLNCCLKLRVETDEAIKKRLGLSFH